MQQTNNIRLIKKYIDKVNICVKSLRKNTD